MNNFLQNFLSLSSWQTWLSLLVLSIIFCVIYKMKKANINFSMRMLFSLVIGLILGFSLQYLNNYPQKEELQNIIWLKEFQTWLSFVNLAFIGLIKMLVIPLISISIIKVIIDIGKDIKISSLLSYSVFWLLLSTAIAASIGVFLGWYFELGAFFNSSMQGKEIREVASLSQILLGLIPSNIINSMSKDNIIAVVIFAFFVGFSARTLYKQEGKEQHQTFSNLVNSLYKIIMNMADFIMSLMPYAVVCMIANVLISNGFSAIKTAGLFIGLIYLCMVIMFLVHFLMLLSVGLNPLIYAKKAFSVWLFAFSSRSSVGTLPLNIATLQNKLGVSSSVANFVPSIGTTMGLNGCAGYFPALAAVFIAYSIGAPIDFNFVVMVILIAILGSIGIAGVPGSATMAASIMLTGIGFGEYFGLLTLILAIDPIIDMARTASNVSGAMSAAICTDKNLKLLDEKVYES
ncbi:cation:dicarboxylate symporter family transporter [Helicobacter burdigaliensis]